MDKTAAEMTNTTTSVPFFSDINNRRFLTAVLAGVLGGAGVGAAANLLRSYREMRKQKKDETDDETIVLTLPSKKASSAYDGMKAAKPGETKVVSTARNGVQQQRSGGRFGKAIGDGKERGEQVKCADGNPGPNSTGTIVANALGMTAGGLLAYDAVSRLFDAMQERKLKRKLKAAQQAYVNAMAGASKRAEIVSAVIDPVEHALCRGGIPKTAGILDILPGSSPDYIRYPVAAYILALLAGTGATAYVTKKVMDKQFPEEKLQKDINSPTRIVFRTEGGTPSLLEGQAGKEKKASAETCAAITAMLPIYMDIVEGAPNRTLSEPYVKMAVAAGTDAEGLMKMAKYDMSQVYNVVMQDPEAVMAILNGTNFGLDFDKLKAAQVLREERPETYRRAVDAAIDAHFAGGPNDGFVRRAWNGIAKAGVKAFAGLGGRDMLVDRALKSASVDDLVLSALGGDDEPKREKNTMIDEKAVADAARARLRRRRRVSVEAADPAAAEYIAANRTAITKLLAKLNARGSI